MEMKERISKINEVAQENFDEAQGMLEMLNDICGTRFGWVNKRVAIFENSNVHDAYIWLYLN